MPKSRPGDPRISWETLPEGAAWTAFNIQYLVADALLLLRERKRHYSSAFSAFSLVSIAFQELGKISMMKELYSRRKNISEKECWKTLRDHDKKVEAAKDYVQQFEFESGRGLAPWFGDPQIEMLRRAALYSDYDFQGGYWRIPAITAPDGHLSGWVPLAGVLSDKELAMFRESTIFKEYQALEGLCHSLIRLLGLSLRTLKARNSALMKPFRYNGVLFDYHDKEQIKLLMKSGIPRTEAQHFLKEQRPKIRGWRDYPKRRTELKIAAGVWKSLADPDALFPRVLKERFTTQLTKTDRFTEKTANEIISMLAGGWRGLRLTELDDGYLYEG